MSRRYPIGLALAGALWACSPQVPAADTAGLDGGDLEAEILQRSDELDTARRGCDKAAVDRILAEGYFVVDIGGRVTERGQSLASLDTCTADNVVNQLGLGRDSVAIHVHGAMAVMTSRVKWKEGDGFVANRNTRVWLREAGEWRLAAQHATRIREGREVQ